jgi:hypothetical protein
MSKDSYYILATMKSMNGQGALPLTACAVGDEGTTTDAGDLAVENGNHVTGKVFTSDNKPIPAGAKVSMGRWDASDSVDVNVGADGKFEFKAVPSGLCEFYIRINGYHISKDNQSYEPMNAVFLLGRIDNDIEDLNVQLDPGEVQRDNGNSNQWQRLQTSQMTGIPASQ